MRRISRALWAVFLFSEKHPRAILTSFLVLFLATFAGATQLRFLINMGDFVTPDFQAYRNNEALEEQFSLQNPLAVVFSPRHEAGFSEAELCAMASWIDALAASTTGVLGVDSPFDLRKPSFDSEKGTLWYRPLLEWKCSSPSAVPGSGNPVLERIGGTPWQGTLTDSRDVLAEFTFANAESKYGRFDPTIVRAVEEEVTRFEKIQPGIRARLSGVAAFQWHHLRGLMQDQALNVLALVILCIGMRLLFGTWRAGILATAAMAIMGISIFGLMAIFGVPVDILTNTLFLLVGITSVQDFLFLTQSRMREGGSLRASFRRIAVPSFFTSFTTIVGFGSLYVSPLEPIQRLGVWAAAGALLEWLLLFSILPAFLKVFPWWTHWIDRRRTFHSETFERLAAWVPGRRMTTFVLVTLLLSSLGIFRSEMNDAFDKTWPASHPYSEASRYLDATRGWQIRAEVVLTPRLSEERQRAVVARLERAGNVARMENPFAVRDYFVKELDEAHKQMVLREISEARAFQRMFSSDGHARATLYLKEPSLKGLEPARALVRELCPANECFLAGDLATYAEFSDHVIGTLLESFIVSLVLVMLILVALLHVRHCGNGIWIVVSSLFAPVLMFGIIGIFEIRINYVTCVFASVIVGICGDNAIQYILGTRQRDLLTGIEARGAGSIFTSLVAIACTLVFLFSRFEHPRTLGLLFAAGFSACLLGDLWLLRGCVRWFGRSSLRPKEST